MKVVICKKCESAELCNRDGECILAWAQRLAADSVACGEMEYGPDYPSNKPPSEDCSQK